MTGVDSAISRRQFAGTLLAGGAAAMLGPGLLSGFEQMQVSLRLGIDNFAVRAFKWKAKELIDYAAKLKVDTLFITDLQAIENSEAAEKFSDVHLAGIKEHADNAGVALLVGTWSICPSSTTFRDNYGTAEEHLSLGIRVAKALGSPAIRVILGSRRDRTTEGGIEARIVDMVKVLKSRKVEAMDAGVKIAVENHAGDMHSLELAELVEAAGPDFVGVNLDSGNAVWTLEDPLQNLKNLGRYVLTTSLRDSIAWKSENGVMAQWTAMGEGAVDWKEYFTVFRQLCPHVAVNIETISGFNREFKLNDDEFWKSFPTGKPKGYEQFLAFAENGKPREPYQRPENISRTRADQNYQQTELERSIAYCRKIGLGVKE